MAKMLQLLMDGPNVNMKHLKKLKEQRNEVEFPGFINFDSCNQHIIHSAFKSGAEASGWNLKELLKSHFQILKDALAICDHFISVTESAKFPLQFVHPGFLNCLYLS